MKKKKRNAGFKDVSSIDELKYLKPTWPSVLPLTSIKGKVYPTAECSEFRKTRAI